MIQVTPTVKRYWNRASCGTNRTSAEKFSLKYFEDIESFRYTFEPFIHSFAQFSRSHGQRVLEVGVGAGTDFLQWVRSGAEAHGVDLTEEAIQNTESRLALYGLEAASLQCCNAERLPFDDGFFDISYSWGVIHHANDMEQVFSEIYRVTRPGGKVKIMVYNLNSLWTFYRYLRHAVPRGRLIGGRKWAVYHFQESIATKVYSSGDIRRLLARYPHENLAFSYHDQIIRSGARFAGIRKLIRACSPEMMRWYMGFEFTKR